MAKVKMQCSPYCSFFPDMTCNNWVYDENDPNIGLSGYKDGEKEHTLTVAEMPKHRHTQISANSGSSGLTGTTYSGLGWSTGNNEILGNAMQNTGGSQPHNNLQPYQVVAYWKRIA